MKYIIIVLGLLSCWTVQGQTDSLLLTYEQFLQQVYQHHPIAQQIHLRREQAAEYLNKARGGFDPKLGGKWDYKNFDDKNYYNILNTYLKIPIWSDIAVETGYNYTNGKYLNPENNLPVAGQMYLGVKVPLLKGLWTSERRTMVQQAQLKLGASEVEIQILLNDLLYKAGKIYWDWTKVYNECLILEQSLRAAEEQLEATKQAFIQGDKPAIDTLKAFIRVQDRVILLTNKRLEQRNAGNLVTAYLWDEQQAPLALPETVVPVKLEQLSPKLLDEELLSAQLNQLQEHPVLAFYDFKQKDLDLERRLKMNSLLPKLDVKYNFLSTNHVDFFGTGIEAPVENYKFGVQFSMPLFIRKERADLALNRLKSKELEWKQLEKQRTLKVKIENYFNEAQNASRQTYSVQEMVERYQTLVDAEKIKFTIGESSIFMVNTRENQLLDAQIKLIKQQIMYLKSRMAFFWTIARLQPAEN